MDKISAGSAPEQLQPTDSFVKRLATAVLILNLFVAGMVWFSLHHSKLNYAARAAVTTLNITQVLDENISGIFAKVDIAMRAVTDAAEQQLAAGAIQKPSLDSFIIREHSRLPELTALRATNASGDAIYGSKVTPAQTTSLAHREYFRLLRDTPDAGLVISKPLIGGISGKWMIILARRINQPDGTFAGLVYAGITLDYLTKNFSKIDVGPHGLISLIDSDLSLVTRYPQYNTAGTDVGSKIMSLRLNEMIQAGKTNGTYIANSSLDSIERTFSFRKLTMSRPFYVVVGLATSDYLSNWNVEVLKMSLFMGIFLVITVLLTWMFYREWSRKSEVERAVLKSEQHLRTIIESLPVPLAIINEHGHVTFLNKTFVQTVGYTMADIPTMAEWWPAAYPDPSYRQMLAELWQKNMSEAQGTGNQLPAVEIDVTCKNNSVRTFMCSTVTTDENFSGTQLIFLYDITDRKKADEEKQVFEQQLQHTQKLESLGVLSGGIAHDFNNILTVIIGYCGLTKMNYETAKKHIPIIETAAERAAELCRQMLAYAGKAQLTRSKVNMVTKVDDIVTMLKSTLPQNAVIKTNLTAEIPLIEGDASQLRQVVMNLIINASEAIGTEHGEVGVSLTKINVKAGKSYEDYHGKTIHPGEYVCLEVTDNGCGMDEATKWRIFEPFYTTKFSGRGLGMSAVLGIIKSHDGALQLFSQPGHGTTFKVYLPVTTNGTAISEDQTTSPPSATWTGSGTILLVEDEDEILLIAKELLEMFGFTVLEAVNGKEALELYKKNAADITFVLTDMGMPVMDGYELFYELKKLKPELPIIISSGYGDAEVSSRIGSDNIAGLISKPYNPDRLCEVLKSVVEGTEQ
jgi:PAS domain S-box-containing protein